LEGALSVVITGEGSTITIESFAEIGAGLKERALPKLQMNIPLDEIIKAIRKLPAAIAPLTAEQLAPNRLLLSAVEASRVDRVSAPPAAAPAPPELTVDDLPSIVASSSVAALSGTQQLLGRVKLQKSPTVGRTLTEQVDLRVPDPRASLPAPALKTDPPDDAAADAAPKEIDLDWER
jgi:hypothetical protein